MGAMTLSLRFIDLAAGIVLKAGTDLEASIETTVEALARAPREVKKDHKALQRVLGVLVTALLILVLARTLTRVLARALTRVLARALTKARVQKNDLHLKKAQDVIVDREVRPLCLLLIRKHKVVKKIFF
jgi:hypothetical protein